jgi:NitT/TauT family transport system permease protein
MAFQVDARTGSNLMLADTLASLERLVSALAISTAVALVFGIVIGLLPGANAMLGPFVSVTSMVPPLALLPILFIVMGLGENSKIALIVIGTMPCIIRDLVMKVQELPREQLIKAQTLGASSWQIALRVALPQMLPRLIDSLRLQLGPAWLFLIAAEAIASDSGLGYRIFLVRRYLAMDIIIPYVAWITLLAFLMDAGLRVTQRKLFPWFASVRAE